jgi:hypothetical protein
MNLQQEAADKISDKIVNLAIAEIEAINEFDLDHVEQRIYVDGIIQLAAKKHRKKYFSPICYAEKYNLAITLSIAALIASISTVILQLVQPF